MFDIYSAILICTIDILSLETDRYGMIVGWWVVGGGLDAKCVHIR